MLKKKEATRTYSAAEKAEALRRAKEVGVAAAWRELGIPKTTMYQWVARARSKERGAEAVKAKKEVRSSRAAPDPGAKKREAKSKVARRYTPSERARALELAAEVGVQAVSAELGIPIGTLYPWVAAAKRDASAASIETDGTERSEAPEPAASSEPAASASAVSKSGKKKRVARIYTPSERARAIELADEVGVTAAARELGMTRFSIYDWQRRLGLFNAGKLESSPLEGSDEDVEAQRDVEILDIWKTHPGLGPSQIRNQLRRAGMKISVHRVRRVMEANGYVPPKVKRTNVHDRRYEAVRPNHLLHLDFLHQYINKLNVYVLLILDDYSRFIVGAQLWEGERADIVLETFEGATQRHGRPEMVMSDGGSAFWSWRGVSRFTRLLEEMGIEQLIAKVPQINGKLEVLNGNLKKELFNVERFFDLEQTRQRFERWVDFYNYRRTHHALGGLLVPADRYFGRSERVLAEIEAGRRPDGVAEALPVDARHLDLLRVTSHRGQPEVHLMGRRIWPPAAV